MKQTFKCPKCNQLAGWFQCIPGVPVQHNPTGSIMAQEHLHSDKERKTCAGKIEGAACGEDISKIVK